MGTPWLAVQYSDKYPPDAEHLPERFGLFTIILLGESVAAVMHGMESQEMWSPSAAISAFTGLSLAFGYWWWYFDGAHGAAKRHVTSNRKTLLFQIWSYAHLPLYLALLCGAQVMLTTANAVREQRAESENLELVADLQRQCTNMQGP